MSLLINQQPEPSGDRVKLDDPRPVWVGCLWDHGDQKVQELIPATATHTCGDLVLCDFWDPRTGEDRTHWMHEEFVRDRPTAIGASQRNPSPNHPAAAPSPTFDVGS